MSAPRRRPRSVVEAAPDGVRRHRTQITLTFSEDVSINPGRLSVLGPDGRTVSEGAAFKVTGPRVGVRLRTGLGRGTYVVSYRVVSADGHPVSGGFPFSVVERSLVQQVTPSLVDPAASERWYVVALLLVGRYLGYIGVVLLTGALLLALALKPRHLPPSAPRRWAGWGWGLLAGGTVLSLVAQAPYAAGGGLSDVRPAELLAMASSTVVQAHVLRLAVLVVALPLLRAVLARGAERGWERAFAAALAVGLFVSWPLAGHGGTGPWWWLTTSLGALHVAAMGLWIGGLAVLVRSALPAADARELGAFLPWWSRTAAFAVVVLVGSGIVQAAVRVPSLDALAGTTYGRLLLAKTTGLAVMLCLAATARRAIRRRYAAGGGAGDGQLPGGALTGGALPSGALPGTGVTAVDVPGRVGTVLASLPSAAAADVDDAPTVRGVRIRASLEIVLSVVTIALATILVQTAPPDPARTLPSSGTAASAETAGQLGGPFYGIDRLPNATVQIDMTPAQVGSNTMLLSAITPAGQPIAIRTWSVRASLPSAGLRNIQVPVETLEPGFAYAFPQLPRPGDWTFTVVFGTSDADMNVVTHTVRIY